IERGVHRADQRVADEFHGDAGIAVEFFFKGENAEGLGEAVAHYTHAPGTRSPELRADVINVFDAAAFEFSGEAQVEAGKIGEDGEGGCARLGLADEVADAA